MIKKYMEEAVEYGLKLLGVKVTNQYQPIKKYLKMVCFVQDY
jgi:hypothetical protein